MANGLNLPPLKVKPPSEPRLSEDALALYHAYRDMVDEGTPTRTGDVFVRAGLTYDRGRAALAELERVGTVREVGNLG